MKATKEIQEMADTLGIDDKKLIGDNSLSFGEYFAIAALVVAAICIII